MSEAIDRVAALIDATGRPIAKRREAEAMCPRCGAGPARRVASAGFGDPHDVCGGCGYEFHGERTK